MSAEPLQTPVAFFIFRRPQTTRRVFEVIASVRPRRLMIIADGARNESEQHLVDKTRELVAHVDWNCEVSHAFSGSNLGLMRRIPSGLNWVFEQVDEAIILEDDCVPDPSFFAFCEAMLAHYRDDERVMHISGDHFHPDPYPEASYYFSRYPHIWGWATWRRAWMKYDPDVQSWRDPTVRSRIERQFISRSEARYWRITWDQILNGAGRTWDYQWGFACMMYGGLAINPACNLVQNIGFDVGATNTTNKNHRLANLEAKSLEFPLRHPIKVEPDLTLEQRIAREFYTPEGLIQKIQRRLFKS